MKNHSEIVAQIDKALIEKFQIEDAKISLAARGPGDKPTTLKEEFYRRNKCVLRIRFYYEGETLSKAIIRAATEFKGAGILWARMAKERIQGISIVFEEE
jgi:hypothetical protein